MNRTPPGGIQPASVLGPTQAKHAAPATARRAGKRRDAAKVRNAEQPKLDDSRVTAAFERATQP